MFKLFAASAVVAVGLAGCAFGIDDGEGRSVNTSFQAPVDASEALKRAEAQMRQCLRSNNDNAVRVQGGQSGQGGRVEIVAPMTNKVFARADVRPSGQTRSDVVITMLNVGVYDADSAAALRESIEFGVPTCRSYMPRVPEKEAVKR